MTNSLLHMTLMMIQPHLSQLLFLLWDPLIVPLVLQVCAPLSLNLLCLPQNECTKRRKSSQGINNDTNLILVINNTHVIIVEYFYPPHFSKINIFMSSHILESFLISEYINMNTIQIMTPHFQSKTKIDNFKSWHG